MEAITSSCSKPLLDGLGSSSPRPRLVSAFHFYDRLEFSSFSNDKVGNLRFLQTVHNKGVSPFHVVPAKPQVDLETEEPQAQHTGEAKVVRVKFQLQKDCMYGEQFHVVGDDPMIGAWDPSNALPMTWSEGHVWSVEMDAPAGKSIQYKFILKLTSGDIIWQPGSDRIVKTWGTVNRITVCEDWENAELQKLIEEEESDHSNGKPQFDSEMSNFSENLDHLEEDMLSDATNNVLDFEDSKTHLEEKPLAQPDMQQIIADTTSSSMESPMPIVAENIDLSEDAPKNTPMPIVAENIDLSEDAPKNTPRRRGVNNMALQSEVTVHDLEHMGKGPQVDNQGKKDVKGNLFEFEEGPVLVPGLTPPKTEETTEDKVEEKVNMDSSVGALETKDQNLPEVQFNEEQEESDDGKPQELVGNEFQDKFHSTTAIGKVSEVHKGHEHVLENEALSDEPELVGSEFQDKFHSTTAIGKVSEVQKGHESALENEALSDEPELVGSEFQDKFHSTTAIGKASEVQKGHESALENEALSDEPELVGSEFQDKFHSTTAVVKASEVQKGHENVLENEALSDEPELVGSEFQDNFHSATAVVKASEVQKGHENVLENEALSDEPELVGSEFQDKFDSTTAVVKVSEVHTGHENVLESDVQWGRGILKKFLSKLGLL
ncbi:uncharacterized protein LOC129288664 isoform X2 [Prosopis cineraria]|uniref:uncharacterized protein LOC129288664 isoform X2 n=1 Tax=Prosopis cineraria TaxID=364024 RepID=UPI00241086C8|nr:uncharacterized protein LOC129288664 isoform X2 [Prosopis cineraria]